MHASHRKQYLFIALASILLLCFLTGCGQTPQPAETTAATTVSTADSTTDSTTDTVPSVTEATTIFTEPAETTAPANPFDYAVDTADGSALLANFTFTADGEAYYPQVRFAVSGDVCLCYGVFGEGSSGSFLRRIDLLTGQTDDEILFPEAVLDVFPNGEGGFMLLTVNASVYSLRQADQLPVLLQTCSPEGGGYQLGCFADNGTAVLYGVTDGDSFFKCDIQTGIADTVCLGDSNELSALKTAEQGAIVGVCNTETYQSLFYPMENGEFIPDAPYDEGLVPLSSSYGTVYQPGYVMLIPLGEGQILCFETDSAIVGASADFVMLETDGRAVAESTTGRIVYEIAMENGCVAPTLYERDGWLLFVTYTFEGDCSLKGLSPRVLIAEHPEQLKVTAFNGPNLNAVCQGLADSISHEFNVGVYWGEMGNQFGASDYVGEAVLSPVENFSALCAVYRILGAYPDGFFADIRENTGGLDFYLATQLTCVSGEGIATAGALTTIVNDKTEITLDVFGNLNNDLPHELMHAIDRRIEAEGYNRGIDYEAIFLNCMPEEIQNLYAYDYLTALDDSYTQYGVEEVWFVDSYAKSWPKEDRARLMEYLMADYFNGERSALFTNEHLVYKARCLSAIIRDCLPSCNVDTLLPWEQSIGIHTIDEFITENTLVY